MTTYATNLWYVAMPARELKRGGMTGRELFGEPVLFGRRADGEVFAFRDICPHRGVLLSVGRFDGREVECPYHGWRFGSDGRCTAIPSLLPDQKMHLDRIGTPAYPCRESQGLIWIHWGEGAAVEDPPVIPEIGDLSPGVAAVLELPCDIDNAVYGLLDPAHGPYVHNSRWWRSRRALREKTKHYVPSRRGFTMARHSPTQGGLTYALLGRNVSTEISFELPGLRIEVIQGDRGTVGSVTAVTPVATSRTRLCHLLYWTMPWLTPLKPVAGAFARSFLKQDQWIMEVQQEGLRHGAPQILINDADTLVKWYLRLKRDWQAAQDGKREFVNPLSETTLRWRT